MNILKTTTYYLFGKEIFCKQESIEDEKEVKTIVLPKEYIEKEFDV